jgi:hypothetical protein
MKIWHTRIACWIPKATNTHSQVLKYLTAFPGQQWLHERPSVLRDTYVAFLVILFRVYVIISVLVFLKLSEPNCCLGLANDSDVRDGNIGPN